MFVLDHAAVKCRDDLNDLDKPAWTSSWTTGGVAIELNSPLYHPNEPADYIAPPTVAPQISPTQWQTAPPIPSNWVRGQQVRYCVSFVGPTFESVPGPFCAFTNVNKQYGPTLTGVPIGPANVSARNVYREFLDKPLTYCGSVADNTTTTFIDTTP